MSRITRWFSDLWFDFFSSPELDPIDMDDRWNNALMMVEKLAKERDNFKKQVDILERELQQEKMMTKMLTEHLEEARGLIVAVLKDRSARPL